ncbi:MAG: choice-of-anchor D domain-containing protein [Bacteroidetes bacterium]|nr:choice-of-anchor D domain-containing protein [bacterium]NBP64189.1 choice-of-anchor D domain-containing protein [Bacteroidota bacterium]
MQLLAKIREYDTFLEFLTDGAAMFSMIRYVAFLLFPILLFSQGSPKRLVVIEEFTSATCKPCVDADKVLKVVAKLDSGIIALKYHLNIPSPGDPFYKANPVHNDTRGSLYAVPALPASRVNGYRSVDPRDSLAMWSAARLDQQMPYPISMSVKQEIVSGNEMKVSVEVNSGIELADYVLHIAVYSDLVKLPNILTTLPGSNGQTEFASSMMTMLPNENGSVWNQAANEKKSISYTYTKGTGELWNSDINVIAFLQNPRTLEIIQASTTLPKQPGSMISTTLSFPPSVAPVYEALPAQGAISLKAEIGNASNAAITYKDLSIVKSARTPADWKLNITGNQSTFTLNPGEKKEISIELQRSAEPGIGEVLLTFSEASGKVYNAIPITIVSKESESFMVQDNASGNVGPFADAVGLPGLKKYIALNTTEFMQNITKFTSLKRFIWHCADSGRIVKSESDFMLSLGDKGISFLVAGQFITNNMFFDKTPLFDTLGLTYAGYMIRNSTYTLNGVQGDTISNGLSLACAPRSYAFYPMRLKNASNPNIVPILKLSTSTTGDTIGGVRVQRIKNRMVYLGLHPFAITDSTQRRTLIDRSLAWLENFTFVPKPALTSSANQLDFGTVPSSTGNSKTVTLSNPGNAETMISTLTINGNDASSFSVQPSNVSVIPAGGSINLTIGFSPKDAGTKNAELLIKSNQDGVNQITIQLKGTYTPSSVHEIEYSPIHIQLSDNITITTTFEFGFTATLRDLSGRVIQSGVSSMRDYSFNIPPSGLYVIEIAPINNPERIQHVMLPIVR